MKKSMFTLVAVVALLVMAFPFMTASAQESQTSRSLSFTEAQVNATFWVTNPRNRHISNVYVNLQPNQVTITATYTQRISRTGATEQHQLSVTMVPALVNGRVQWNVAAASADGQPASAELLAQINAHLAASWRRWVSSTRPAGRLTGVAITEETITFTYN
ncbi:MAG: hypothetical protein JNL42_14785 [Anaerolineae bacterium]|nr:hypothetical protein [Anaerolineae bacterium]